MKSKRKILAYLILFHHLIYMLRRCKRHQHTGNKNINHRRQVQFYLISNSKRAEIVRNIWQEVGRIGFEIFKAKESSHSAFLCIISFKSALSIAIFIVFLCCVYWRICFVFRRGSGRIITSILRFWSICKHAMSLGPNSHLQRYVICVVLNTQYNTHLTVQNSRIEKNWNNGFMYTCEGQILNQ